MIMLKSVTNTFLSIGTLCVNFVRIGLLALDLRMDRNQYYFLTLSKYINSSAQFIIRMHLMKKSDFIG